MTEARRHRRHIDRHGRGMLGPISRPSRFAPRGLPLQRSGAAQFDEVVAIEVTRLEKRLPQVVARVEFAIEDVPNLDLDAREIPLTHSTGGTSHEPYRIVVFRRPIELRAERSATSLAWLVRSALVLELADVLALSPEQIDPDFDPDDD
ncbi:metallopeptidase family protein [Kribbella sp. NPDC050281]|uniref:metallopeptidase family protein n=1 Tax=unclassified Kribbella TaxID=2644121 RepID=UPI00340606A2